MWEPGVASARLCMVVRALISGSVSVHMNAFKAWVLDSYKVCLVGARTSQAV